MNVPQKSHTFRVRQLPHHLDRLQATALLVRLLDGTEVDIVSIAPTVNPWERPPTKVATVNFKSIPERFRNGETEWVISTRSAGLAQNIIVDDHFCDFTVLNEVNSNIHRLDCIAISGLASHPFGSWKTRTPDSNFMWLRDGLPTDLPSIRTIIYGYKTKLLLSQSFQNIDDLAVSLVLRLKSVGRSSPSAKPLCFLVHSLGGIIFKRAMVILANGGDAEHSILKSITSAIFFGVPNRGMFMSHFLPMVAGYPNQTLIEQLSPNSEYLKILEEQFTGIANLEKMRLISVYETERSMTTKQLPTGEWERSGPYEILVDKKSAIQRGCNLVDTFPINKDHSALVKFNENDSDYRGILIRLEEISQGASTQEMPSYRNTQHIHAAISPSREEIGSYGAVETNGELGVTSSRQLYYNQEAAAQQKADDKLAFRDMMDDLRRENLDFRFNNIDKAFETTFHWIFDDSSLEFAQWLKDGLGIYWISGKPGSGKSTLMKYLCNDPKTTNALARCKQPGKQIIASFFFYNRGSALQRSFEGLLRSILHQILTVEPLLGKEVLPIFRKSNLRWTLSALESAFEALRGQRSILVNIHLFLDALDEYDGSLGLVCEFLKSVTNPPRGSATRLQSYPGFKIHEHTLQDISNYIYAKIEQNPTLNRLLSTKTITFSRSKSELVEELIERAKGMYLWVNLTIVNLSRAATEGTSSEEITRILSEMPEELEDLYEQIIARTDSYNRQECYIMLEIVHRSFFTLPLPDFLVAVACARQTTVQNCRSLIPKNGPSSEELDNMIRRIKSRCGGLLEVVNYKGHQFVELMHQTVKDFVGRPSFQQLAVGQDYSLHTENGFSFLSKYTLALIATGHQYYLSNVIISTDGVTFSAKTDCLSYAHLAETSTGKSRVEFFHGISDSMLTSCYLGRFPTSIITLEPVYPINTIMSFGVVANLKLFVKEKLQSSATANANPVMSLLHCAVISAVFGFSELLDMHARLPTWGPKWGPKTNEMVQLLLDHGANEGALFDNLTPFQILMLAGSRQISSRKYKDLPQVLSEIAMTFLRLGQNHTTPVVVSIHGLMRGPLVTCRPIHVAVCLWRWSGAIAVVRLLLGRGVDVNALNDRGLTPLDMLLSGRHNFRRYGNLLTELGRCHAIAMLLIEAGARVTHKGFDELDGFISVLQPHYDVEAIKRISLLDSVSKTAEQSSADELSNLRHRFSSIPNTP